MSAHEHFPGRGAPPVPEEGESARVIQARLHARERVRRQRETLRALGLGVIAAVILSAVEARPHPGLTDDRLGVTLALAVFALTLAPLVRDWFRDAGSGAETLAVAALAGAAVALAFLQPHGVTELAGGAAVWTAITRLPLRFGAVIAAFVVGGLDLADAQNGGSAASLAGITVLCLLLGLVGLFLNQTRASQEQTELLLAQLEDAREQQLEAAATAERGRIAGELHDVLAHALSGAAIQLQGARLLADQQRASTELRATIDRAGELVREGLDNARQAVGALRGGKLPGVEQLAELVESFCGDVQLDVTLCIEGGARQLPVEASLALYRGAQEALTNVARYAPGASTRVLLRYEPDRTVLSVENGRAGDVPRPDGELALAGVGGGRGLAGMRERLARSHGSLQAGPTASGWRVELDVPA